MGKGNLAKWWRFFIAYEIPTYLIFDNDDEDDTNTERRKDALQTLGVDSEEIDSFISNSDWIVNDKFCIFGRDFEATLRLTFPEYTAFEIEAKDVLGDSKPLIARYVAQKLAVDDSDVWGKFIELKESIQALSV